MPAVIRNNARMTDAFPVRIESGPAGEYRLSWDPSAIGARLEVLLHRDPETRGQAESITHADGGDARLPGAMPGVRHYFLLRDATGRELRAAERALPLEGGTNFRDMGGYEGAGGRRVRWGRLYRSGHTAGLTEADRALLDTLDIRVCCDFRRIEEHSVEPSRLPEQTRIVSAGIDPGSTSSFFERIAEGSAGPAEMVEFMLEANRAFVTHHSAQYRRMFEELLALEAGAFMINCAAGKDRTGFGAAMILAALGVAEHDILADYRLSHRYYPIEREIERVQKKYGNAGGRTLDLALIRPMMATDARYLQSGLRAIDAEYGGIDAFLEEALGLGPRERAGLQDRLLD